MISVSQTAVAASSFSRVIMAILTQVTAFDKRQFDMIGEASSRLAHDAASSRPITSDGLSCTSK